ncbi:MAG: DUF4390 domain-containing protein [Thermodesulfobacteriota bacterium]
MMHLLIGMKGRLDQILIICLIGFFSVTGTPASANAAQLSNLVVSNTRDNLLLFVRVEGAFTEKMKEAVLNGIPTTFSFLVKLEEVHTLLPDKTITEFKVNHTIKYDSLKKQFVVKRSWEDNRAMTTSSFAEAQQWMSEIKSLSVVELNKLDKGTRYQVHAKAELDKVQLPFFLNYVFFFISLWDFETSWQSVDFVY